MSNDYRRLKEEADIEAVVNYLQIEVTRRGNAYFILCPLPQHDDHRATNCYFKPGWNNVFCRACNEPVNAIDLIMYTTGKSYGEARDLLWELEGSPEWYYETNTRQPKEEEFRLSREEAEVIGIHFPGRLLAPVKEQDSKETLPRGFTYDSRYVDSYLQCRVCPMTWRDFMSEGEYYWMLRKKIYECLDKTKALKAMFVRLQNCAGGQERMIEASDFRIQTCYNVLKRLKKCEKCL